MREIKFRAWDNTSNKMNYRVLVGNTNTDDPCSIVWCDNEKKWLNFDKYCGCFMQYTGLKDKSGVEIYEGDIVTHGSLTDRLNGVEFIAKIVFNMGGFYIEGLNCNRFECVSIPIRDRVGTEVIGNIHENPELLNGEKI